MAARPEATLEPDSSTAPRTQVSQEADRDSASRREAAALCIQAHRSRWMVQRTLQSLHTVVATVLTLALALPLPLNLTQTLTPTLALALTLTQTLTPTLALTLTLTLTRCKRSREGTSSASGTFRTWQCPLCDRRPWGQCRA